MDFCFSKPFRHRKQLPSLCTPWISASVSRLGTGSSFPAIILHKSKHLRRIYLIKSTDVPKRPEITAYLRGTYLMKSIAVPKRLEITAYLRGTYLMKSTAVPKRPEITAYLRGTYLMKSIAVPNILKPLHTCGEQISNNLPPYLSSRLTVLIYSEQIQELFKNSSGIAIEIPKLTKKNTKLFQACKYCTCFSSMFPGLFS